MQYEWSAATSAEAAAEKRLEETKVEHDAVADGVFIGDSYNDSPNSAQRETELKLKKGELDAQLAAVRTQIKHVGDQISQEEARYRLRSEAVVGLPTEGPGLGDAGRPRRVCEQGSGSLARARLLAPDRQRECR